MKISRRNTRRRRQDQGEERPLPKKDTYEDGYRLNSYRPVDRQNDIVESMEEKALTIVNSPSGTGKSSTIIWKALHDFRLRKYQKIILIKTPSEAGDDTLGYLSGNKGEKLSSHMQSMTALFLQFLTKNKLENEVSNGNIVFEVPNYLLGATLDNSIIILEEAQTMSPNTIKLCAERAGRDSIVVVAGDSNQRYSAKKRCDGFEDLIERVTYEQHDLLFSYYPKTVGYIEMDSSHNMRSELSKFITDIY